MMGQRPMGMSLADFLNQGRSDNKRGGGPKRLRKWKDKAPYSITTWLHPKASFLDLWRHPFVRVEAKEDKESGDKTREVWYDPLVCYEFGKVNEEQNYRDKMTGRRNMPPVLCPIDLMLEDIYQMIESNRIDWKTPIFEFKGSDPSKGKVYRAGGMTGHFNSRKLTEEERKELAEIHVYQSGDNAAFKWDLRPKLEWAFVVADNEDLAAGWTIEVVTRGLGDKVVEVISKSMKELGERGNPLLHPYAIEWQYNPTSKDPKDKYDATRMSQIARSASLETLFRQEPPSFEKLAERFNLQTMRARLEQHLIYPPFKPLLDKWFEPAMRAERQMAMAQPGTRVPDNSMEVAPAPMQVAPTIASHAPLAQEEELFGCETAGCTGVMRATDAECPVCHRRYLVEQAAAANDATVGASVGWVPTQDQEAEDDIPF